MYTLRLRMRITFSALFAAAMLAAVFAPLAPVPQVAAQESRVMATEQVYVRSGPSTADAIIGELLAGDWISTTGHSENGFAEVWYGDWVGYVYADYLGSSSTSSTTSSSGSTSSDVSWGSDGWLYTTDSVNLRSGAGTGNGIVATLPSGTSVYHTGASSNGFAQVDTDYGSGWVHADYLGNSAPAANSSSSNITWGSDGWLYTSGAVNLRSGASTNDGIVAVLPAGTSVYHTGASSNGFAQVDSDYGSGWVHGDYLGASAPVAAPAVSTQGQQIVNFAMQFHGYPYVWAGNTPSGFDCSGFTQYVVQNVLGYDITHSTDLQAGYGSAVAWGEWQPGDLVFFVGTGGGGYISHVGIYIGDGQFIHAENPGTGVVVSSLYSSYYSNHYYSARRL